MEVLSQCLVLERIPADAEPEPQAAAGEHVHLGGLLGRKRGLALRQDDDARHELDRPRACGDEPEQDERLVERLRGVVVPADDVVERDDVLEALVLGGRRELADRARVVADLVLREDDADVHDGHPVMCAPATTQLAECLRLRIACSSVQAWPPARLPDCRTPSKPLSMHWPARCARARGGRDAQRVQAAVRNRVAALTAAPAGQLAAADLARSLRVLDISMSEAGRLFGVSRSAVEQWLVRGVPGARLARAANLARIADILERNLKPERIAAVVREPARAYGTKSILDLVREGRDEQARAALEQAFDWSRTA